MRDIDQRDNEEAQLARYGQIAAAALNASEGFEALTQDAQGEAVLTMQQAVAELDKLCQGKWNTSRWGVIYSEMLEDKSSALTALMKKVGNEDLVSEGFEHSFQMLGAGVFTMEALEGMRRLGTIHAPGATRVIRTLTKRSGAHGYKSRY